MKRPRKNWLKTAQRNGYNKTKRFGRKISKKPVTLAPVTLQP